MLELTEAIGVEPEFAPARKGEIARSCLDVSRAAELLGWRAEVPLDEGLERTLAASPAAARARRSDLERSAPLIESG